MEDLVFQSKSEFNKFLSTLNKFEYQGSEGETYFNNDKVIKLFNLDKLQYIENLDKFRNIFVEDFYFIRAGIYINKELVGIISDYANGNMIYHKSLSDVNMRTLIYALKRLEKNVNEISKNKILVDDVFAPNILFDKNHFNFIDTTYYTFDTSSTVNNIKEWNMSDIIIDIFNCFFPNYLLCYVEGKGFFDDKKWKQEPSKTINKIINYLKNELGCEFHTFEEANKILIKKFDN